MNVRLGLAAALLLFARSASADCIDYSHAPAAPPPAALWEGTELRPGAIVVDSTAFDGTQLDDGRLPRPADADVEDGILFVAYRGGLQIRDARGDLAASPSLLSTRGLWEGDFPGFTARTAEFRDLLWGIDAPAGDPTVFALAGVSPVGFSIWDATDPSAPVAKYVDASAAWLLNVWVADVGGSTYAFTSDAAALSVYDVGAARALGATCIDDPSASRDCGVFVGSTGPAGRFLDGFTFEDRSYVATSGGSYAATAESVRLWDVSDPAEPVLVASGAAGPTWGVGAWSDGGRALLAVRAEDGAGARLDVYDVTECAKGGCDWPAPIASVPLVQDAGIPELLRVVSTGRMHDVPVVYTSSLWSCVASGTTAVQPQHDYLFDLRDPAAPREVTPPATIDWLGRTIDYWSWYYTDQLGGGEMQKGFNHVFPGGMAFAGPYAYRAFGTILDVHEWTPADLPISEEPDDVDESTGDDGGDGAPEIEERLGGEGGCGCGAVPSASGVPWVVALALWRRRRPD